MEVVEIELGKLHQDPNNARTHDEKNLSAIKSSLSKFGQQHPIIIDKNNMILAGNGRYQAAKEMGWDKIACVVSDLESITEKTAFAIADNRTAELADWDKDVLGKELLALQADGLDLEELGFDSDDLDFLPDTGLGEGGNTEDDEVPEVEENIHGVKRGDIWQLGEHRLMCGDSTSKEDVDRLMQGDKADMVFTDPPYGMGLDTDHSKSHMNNDGRHTRRSKGQRANSYRPVVGDDKEYDPSHLFELGCHEMFLFGADYYAKRLPDGGSWIVWDKRTTKDGDSRLDAAHGSAFELCWSKQKHKRVIARILHCGLFSVENVKRQHPTQKPIALSEFFFDRWGKDKNLIVDLFLGSGSTLIACEKTNRKCYGMEIDPHYCSVIIERWQNYTGKEAKRVEENGSSS